MTTTLLFASPPLWPAYEAPLRRALDEAGLGDAALVTEAEPEAVDYIIYAPNSDVKDFSVFPDLKAVLNLWAGVEGVVGNETLTVPLTRMVDSGLTEGMVEWVTGHVLRHHLGIDANLAAQDGTWSKSVPPLARDRAVGVLGLGQLGAACARALAGLNFDVAGWSRSPKTIDGIACHHGDSGLDAVLARSEILVLLLPLTDETDSLMNAARLSRLPQGAVLVNPGRGQLIDDAALIDALDAGHLAHATLDVFRTEPLPPEHPFWAHPKVTVTPHIASETRPASASRAIAANIARAERGEPLHHVVDRDAGY
ncbi:2-hydroxyacid dehydrogenase [Tranquillimonas rosea]|uniref:2-hydroxyacid dehydrogenase n=1 Tax=Tranquillimonas rosea TaxID=641238 RepID=UPI003BAA6209